MAARRFTAEKLLPIYRRAVQPRTGPRATMTFRDVLLTLAERPVGPVHEQVVERELQRLAGREVTRGS